jgi:integrase/recombinase XerD
MLMLWQNVRETMTGARTLADKELKLILAHCHTRQHSTRDRTIIHVSVLAGLRACELAALRIGDVYDADGKPRSSTVLDADQTKGPRARRIYINSQLQRALREYWPVIEHRSPNTALFTTRYGQPFSANTMSQLFLNIYHSVGLRGCSSHSGRKTFITRLADKGVAVHLLAALAGHRHISTTQRYITVNEALLSRAVELV